jgi:peptidoglycan/LPS O-acetylase OafA/YrhL
LARLSATISRLPRLQAPSDDFQHLDTLRILASVVVILTHFRVFIELGPLTDGVRDWLGNTALVVDLFFVISGILLARFYGRIHDWAGYRSFLRRRFARLVPLHWVMTTLVAGWGLLMLAGLVPTSDAAWFDYNCLPANYLLLHAMHTCPTLSFNYPSWSISGQLLMSLALPAVLIAHRRDRRLVWVGFVAVMALLFLHPGYHGDKPWWDRTFDFGAVRVIPALLFGVGLHDLRTTLKRWPHPAAWMWGCLGLQALGLTINVGFGHGAELVPGAALVPLAYLAAASGYAADLRQQAGFVVRRVSPWGQLSYSAYMIHGLVGMVLLSCLGRAVLGLHGLALDLLTTTAFAIVLALSYASLHLIENPARDALSGRGKAQARSSAVAQIPGQYQPVREHPLRARRRVVNRIRERVGMR